MPDELPKGVPADGEDAENSDSGASETPEVTLDPSLAEAMAAAEASYERMASAARGDQDDPGDDAFAADVDPEGGEIEIPVEPSRPVPTGASEGLVRALAQLREALEARETAEKQAADLDERLKRVAADFENYKKRVQRERDTERKFATESLVKDLLPSVDNLERALEASEGASVATVIEGVTMVRKQLLDTLGRYGAVQFSALGKPFDPALHEAMQQAESADHAPGTVMSEYMKGYTLHERLIRPAMVVVSKAPENSEMSGDAGPEDEVASDEPSGSEGSGGHRGGE